ncbi:hypothetical protein MPL1032_10284 [Mesorhizobium plurifarium]|uniref:Uncharacterized protein n=1 Tax=Mesorhizobium plurifarium TaxID=69974 RepID=A0A0K2VMT7_MESPL|nr:hypothetical protein MPL1032_10284 [Mesorhizobium plurifarium]
MANWNRDYFTGRFVPGGVEFSRHRKNDADTTSSEKQKGPLPSSEPVAPSKEDDQPIGVKST